jgi:hypothetical protein
MNDAGRGRARSRSAACNGNDLSVHVRADPRDGVSSSSPEALAVPDPSFKLSLEATLHAPSQRKQDAGKGTCQRPRWRPRVARALAGGSGSEGPSRFADPAVGRGLTPNPGVLAHGPAGTQWQPPPHSARRAVEVQAAPPHGEMCDHVSARVPLDRQPARGCKHHDAGERHEQRPQQHAAEHETVGCIRQGSERATQGAMAATDVALLR